MNCPPCTGTCQNTRNCPARMVTKNSGNTNSNDLPIVMFDGPDVWLKDMVLVVVWLAGIMAIGVGVVVLAVYLASLL